MKKSKDKRDEQLLTYISLWDKIRLVNKKGPKVYLMCEFNICYKIVSTYQVHTHTHTYIHIQTWGEFVYVYIHIIFVS